MSGTISERKDDHLDLCASDAVAFRSRTTLLEDVRLVHQALPEATLAQVDLTTRIFGQTFSAPLYVSGMTGGTSRSQKINEDLAAVAEALGLPMGLGSQRAMWLHPDLAPTFSVRGAAPKAFVIGNLGVVQAGQMSTDEVRSLLRKVGAQALAIHLNPAMELVQDDGDRDFRGGRKTIRRLVDELGLPVVVKETGCGLSMEACQALAELGVTHLDVAGAGGTSWVGVEAQRAKSQADTRQAALGEALWDWGIPTAASVAYAAATGATVLASGGIRHGLDVCRALALGATAAGLAAPVLKAHLEGGREGVRVLLGQLMEEIRTILLLCGCTRPAELASRPTAKVIVGELRQWLELLQGR